MARRGWPAARWWSRTRPARRWRRPGAVRRRRPRRAEWPAPVVRGVGPRPVPLGVDRPRRQGDHHGAHRGRQPDELQGELTRDPPQPPPHRYQPPPPPPPPPHKQTERTETSRRRETTEGQPDHPPPPNVRLRMRSFCPPRPPPPPLSPSASSALCRGEPPCCGPGPVGHVPRQPATHRQHGQPGRPRRACARVVRQIAGPLRRRPGARRRQDLPRRPRRLQPADDLALSRSPARGRSSNRSGRSRRRT